MAGWSVLCHKSAQVDPAARRDGGKRMRTTAKALVAGFLVATALPAWAPAEDGSLTLPAGSTLHVKLTTTLTSKTNKAGDKFTGMVDQPVIVNRKEVVPQGSTVNGHVTFIKPAKRIKGRAEMRIVLDDITTPDDVKLSLNGTLQDAQGAPCAKTDSDNEGTVKGCGKSKKDAAKDAAMGAAMGAGAGATVGMGSEIDCRYYGNCGGPGMGTDVMYGAGIGAATTLIYNLLKHEKEIILIRGTHLTFVVNRSVEVPPPTATANSPTNTN